jgi:hypothetical protein
MERRQQSRHSTQFPARLRLLGPVEKEFEVRVEEVSGAGVRITAPEPIPVSAAVRLEWEDAMFLGECVHSGPAGKGGYAAGIHFEQVLSGLQDLRNLMLSLMAETRPGHPGRGRPDQQKQPTGSRSRKSPRPD